MIPAFCGLLLLCLVLPLGGQIHPFASGEKLIYTTGFRLLAVGVTTMEVHASDSTLHIVSQVNTTPPFDWLYPIDDRVDIWVDPISLELRRMERDIHEGNYSRQDTSWVDSQAGLIFGRDDTVAVDGPVFDPIGAIYYLRSQSLNQGDTFTLNIFDGRRLRPMAITVSARVKIKVPAGEFDCLVLSPTALDNRPTTKAGGLLKLWLTTGPERIPVRVEQTTNFGTMVLKLKEIK